MSNIRIIHRYAKSFFTLAKEKKLIDNVEKDLIIFTELCHTNKDLSQLLKSPIIDDITKKNIILSLFNKQFSPLTLTFLKLTITKGRANYLIKIVEEFIFLLKEDRNIKTVEVTSATPLVEKQKQSICSFVEKKTNKKIEIKEIIDPSIIGGFIVKFDDLMLNQSVLGQLSKMKSKLIKN